MIHGQRRSVFTYGRKNYVGESFGNKGYSPLASVIKGLRMGFVLFVSSQGKIVEGNIILLLEYVLNIQCDTPTLFPSSTGGSQSALFNFTPARTPLKFRPLREEIAPSM